MNVNLTVEYPVRAAVQHSLVQLVARAVGSYVLDARLVVDVLGAVGEIETVERAGRRISVERRVDVRPRERAAHRE